MSFDGEFVTERPNREDETFESIDKAWDHSNDMGSRWYFYPFHFVTTASGKTIADAPDPLRHLRGQRVKTVARRFGEVYKENQDKEVNAEQYAFLI